MADTGTIKKLADEGELASAKAEDRPDRARNLALDAIDEAFQDRVKLLYSNLETAMLDPSDDGALGRATEGYKFAVKARDAFRKQITDSKP
jgi:hypothetical protein